MLVLSRMAKEEIVIGDNIRIIVNRIKGRRVSLAIEAPGMEIHKKETYDEIKREKQDAIHQRTRQEHTEHVDSSVIDSDSESSIFESEGGV